MDIPQAVLAFVLSLVMLACDGTAAGETPTPSTPPPGATPGATVTPVPGQLMTRQLTVTDGTTTREVTAEIARTPAERARGLMFRDAMDEDRGMLFLFPGEVQTGFWMQNTRIPLTIAYLDADGRVMEMKDGKPGDETVLTPREPYRYVLEMNQGWFGRHGFGVGSVVSIPGDIGAQ